MLALSSMSSGRPRMAGLSARVAARAIEPRNPRIVRLIVRTPCAEPRCAGLYRTVLRAGHLRHEGAKRVLQAAHEVHANAASIGRRDGQYLGIRARRLSIEQGMHAEGYARIAIERGAGKRDVADHELRRGSRR